MKSILTTLFKNILIFSIFLIFALASGDPSSTTDTYKSTDAAYSIMADTYRFFDGLDPNATYAKEFHKSSIDPTQLNIKQAYLPILKRFLSKDQNEWNNRYPEWNWLDKMLIRDLPLLDTLQLSTKELNNTNWRTREWKNITHILVFSPLPMSQMPKIIDDESFETGIFEGWMYLYDVNARKIVSQDKLEVYNSDHIKYNTGGYKLGRIFNDDPKQEIKHDFQKNFKLKVDSLTSSSIDISVGYTGF